MICMHRDDSDQLAHLPSLIRVFTALNRKLPRQMPRLGADVIFFFFFAFFVVLQLRLYRPMYIHKLDLSITEETFYYQ